MYKRQVQKKLNQAVVAKMLAGETVDEKLKGAAEIINALSEELEAARADKQEEA